ncbi:MAG: LytTR family transcriptional regulator [Bacteroidales bacterium]|nr:LytTR family transcriptional regulator [Bacteroidales bacterium]
MSKKIPLYLVEKNQLIGSVVFTVLFAIVFLNIYSPLSTTAWFGLGKSIYFFFTVGFISLATMILVLSRVIMYKTKDIIKLSYLQYILWIIVEIILIAIFYTYVTWEYINGSQGELIDIFPKALLYTSVILIVPYIIYILYCSINDKNKTLRLLSYSNVVSDGEEMSQNAKLIHLTDNNGNLRLSVKLENLYYIESQDNYIKVYYQNKGAICNYMLRCKLKTIEDSFAESTLIRCHRSYIVNSSKIKVLRKEKEGTFIDLDCDGIDSIPVSKGYSERIQHFFSKK